MADSLILSASAINLLGGGSVNKFSLTCGASACLVVVSGLLVGGAHAQTAATPNWTGFYVGAHIGNATSGSNWKDAGGAPVPVPFAGQFTGGGIVFGAQAGYNYQVGRFIFGLEGEGSFADIDGGAQCASALAICDAKIKALGSLTGRLGYAASDFLLYGKAGGAWLYENLTMASNPGSGDAVTWQSKQFRPGLAFGAGVEYAFSPATSARLEYNYLAFGSDRVVLSSLSGDRLNIGLDQNIHLIKMGLNYKLTGAPLRPSPQSSFAESSSATSAPQIWNGVYAGVHTGGGFGNSDWKSATGALGEVSSFEFPGSGTMDGMIAGGQIGFNRQFGSLVVGGEIDASWANLGGFSKCATGADGYGNFHNFTCRSGIDALGTFAGRLGWAHDNFLIYAKAGAAWAKENDLAENGDLGASFRGRSVRWGYMLGSGVEYAFSPAWSGKVEYNVLNFGTKTTELGSTFDGTSDVGIGQRAHIFKMGVNYRIGADPAAAALAFTPPQDTSDWQIDVGTRYWYSSGSIQKDLYDPSVTSQLNSRLIYGGMEGHSAEAFARLDHRSGVFVKGNFGLGSLVNGKLNDEDFGPANAIYSNTEHQVEDSSLRYGSIDVGKILMSGNGSELGAYAGYRYFYQRGRGFGCTQVGADKDLCGTPIPASMLGLTETGQWRGAAIGLNARLADSTARIHCRAEPVLCEGRRRIGAGKLRAQLKRHARRLDLLGQRHQSRLDCRRRCGTCTVTALVDQRGIQISRPRQASAGLHRARDDQRRILRTGPYPPAIRDAGRELSFQRMNDKDGTERRNFVSERWHQRRS